MYTLTRESSARLSSKEGFSVVAPTSTMSPASTKGRKASCWARLKRWISSTKSTVRRPSRRLRSLRLGHDRPRLFDPGEDRGERHHLGAGGVRQKPRDGGLAGPGRAPEDQRGELAVGEQRANHSPFSDERVLAHHLIEIRRAHAFGEWRCSRGRPGTARWPSSSSAPHSGGGPFQVEHSRERGLDGGPHSHGSMVE